MIPKSGDRFSEKIMLHLKSRSATFGPGRPDVQPAWRPGFFVVLPKYEEADSGITKKETRATRHRPGPRDGDPAFRRHQEARRLLGRKAGRQARPLRGDPPAGRNGSRDHGPRS